MQRSITRRAIGVVGLGSLTAAVTLAGVGTAQASGNDKNNCGRSHIEHSEDGGKTWSDNGRINDPAPTKITVRLTDKVNKGCTYVVSLASYSAEGPTWDTSGTQAFLGWDTTQLDHKNTRATLDVSAYAPSCFGQIDLYGNGIKYDGGEGKGHGKLPRYPYSATPENLITAWNGSAPCSTPSPSPSDSVTDSPSPSPSETTDSPEPSDSTTTSPEPSDSETTSPSPTDSVTDTPSESPSETPSDTPSTTPSSSAPVVDDTTSPTASPTNSAGPVGSPVVEPASDTSSGDLAETGGNGSQTVAFAGGGAALLVLGAGAVYFTRRRNSSAHR
ncbi:LAETG motif-containing sortase-dependent surface protein [Streptomyces sp. NPDC087422]|uniref:LAETG motif-containing sortase-dependent surface protein n=1 Tax=Streptomyces sp. NPDC087422 TaxID=3365786 RepID=UPI003810DB03